jgi:acetylornithine deacetylase
MISDSVHQARRLLRPLEKDLVRLLQLLVQANTVSFPGMGGEHRGQQVLADFLQQHGLAPELYAVDFLESSNHRYARKDRSYIGRKNLQVTVGGSGRGKSLLTNGHMDTVPAQASSWTDDPWSGQIHQGRLYGLGSFDMKGGLVAQFALACALRNGGIRLGGDLICESVVDEEWGGGSGTLAARLRGSAADACVISEGTQLGIYRASRGGAVIDLSFEAGDAEHYFSAEQVISPALELGRLLRWVETWVQQRAAVTGCGAYREFADPAPLQVLAVESNRLTTEVPLSVPQHAAIRLYFQFLPDEDCGAVLAEVRRSLEQFAEADPFFRNHPIAWSPFYDPPLLGHELGEDHPWTACLSQAAAACLGAPPLVTAAPYPCDAFLLQREFQIPTLLFGPRGAGAHNRDEYVEIDSVIQTAETILAAALEWCGAS